MPQAEEEQIHTWTDMVRAFMEQNIYMLEMALDWFTLQSTRKGLDENYKEYITRWKKVVSQVEPSLTNGEIYYIGLLKKG